MHIPKIKEIFSRAKANLIIVDAYADITTLDMLKKLNIDVIVITKQNELLTNMDIKKYNNQYHNLTINYTGTRTFSINILEDKEVCDALKNKVDKIISKK